ncbi:MAG: ClpXP protease specificity-enhancing factor SspB [Hyphomicrobiales bacterium]|nr:ClpXP protease specificity-enhancing factor SspB [Hyphomicrobiales bacterium]
MAEDLFRYDLRAQKALRGVVREVLGEVAETGLPGEHHFYVTINTAAPGVELSERLKARHPSEMTIVLQHQFWNLKAGKAAFEVSLSFNDTPEHLTVPYAAIKGFFDPSVQFGLQFEPLEPAAPAATAGKTGGERPASAAPAVPAPPADSAEKVRPRPKTQPKTEVAHESAEVVQLDAFRKKS